MAERLAAIIADHAERAREAEAARQAKRNRGAAAILLAAEAVAKAAARLQGAKYTVGEIPARRSLERSALALRSVLARQKRSRGDGA